MILKFGEFLKESEEFLSKAVIDLEQKIWNSKNGPAKVEWEEISQSFLDGEGREEWKDLEDTELAKAKSAAEALIDKYKIR